MAWQGMAEQGGAGTHRAVRVLKDLACLLVVAHLLHTLSLHIGRHDALPRCRRWTSCAGT